MHRRGLCTARRQPWNRRAAGSEGWAHGTTARSVHAVGEATRCRPLYLGDPGGIDHFCNVAETGLAWRCRSGYPAGRSSSPDRRSYKLDATGRLWTRQRSSQERWQRGRVAESRYPSGSGWSALRRRGRPQASSSPTWVRGGSDQGYSLASCPDRAYNVPLVLAAR
jgi:hypothetical protein